MKYPKKIDDTTNLMSINIFGIYKFLAYHISLHNLQTKSTFVPSYLHPKESQRQALKKKRLSVVRLIYAYNKIPFV